jgi:hypothetical protein
MKRVAVVDRDIARAMTKRVSIDWHPSSLSLDQLFSFAKMQAVDQGNSTSGIQLLTTVKMVFDVPGAPYKLYGIAITFSSSNTFVVSDKKHENDVIDALIEDAKQNGIPLTFVVAEDNKQSIALLQDKGFSDPGGIESLEAKFYGVDIYTMVKSPIFDNQVPNPKYPPDNVFDVDTEGRV